jgi:hypothetical protein
MKKTKADYWAPRINAEWRKSVEGILNVGRKLIAAKEACEYGEFLRMFKGHENAVCDPVPFSVSSADKLMSVASCEAFTDSELVPNLPQSWGTLYAHGVAALGAVGSENGNAKARAARASAV